MAKADCHVHSRYSDHPSEWFLQRLGTSESYTDPEFIYRKALERGMDFVTLTDHNEIRGTMELKEKYPDRVFTGVESTAYFPEDRCKLHILVYGITPKEFEKIEKYRDNVYRLRDYLRGENLAHSVAHATYAVNNRLTQDHLEKLILLFDTFEGINGAREALHNQSWQNILRNLTPEQIDILRAKHRIVPASETPWIKGFTGGSDDHAGIFIAKTFTETHAKTPEEFVDALKRKRTECGGRSGNFQTLAFSIYKIAYDFSRSKSKGLPEGMLSQISALVFGQRKMGWFDRVKLHFMKNSRESEIRNMLADLMLTLRSGGDSAVEENLDLVYDRVSDIADGFVGLLAQSIRNDLKSANLAGMLKSVSGTLPAVFLAAPFLTAFQHQHSNKHLLVGLGRDLGQRDRLNERKRILWFTDTLNDLNGVSVTLKTMGWLCHQSGRDLKLAASLLPSEISGELPPNVLNIPSIFDFKLPYYEKLTLKLPSILKAMKMIYETAPDEIYISSPGPLGLLGLLFAKLFQVPCTGVYHTDFTREAAAIGGEEGAAGMVEALMRWFYGSCTRIAVPSREYIQILRERGYDSGKMVLFRRGLDTRLFSPQSGKELPSAFVPGNFHLIYTGRISKDKNLEFLLSVFEKALKKNPKLRLVMVGDGPDLNELERKMSGKKEVVFTGKLPNAQLPTYYSAAQLLVFPSTTDTFGMTVLEAQSCGLPALVSPIGGPREIIRDGLTGWALSVENQKFWEEKILELGSLYDSSPADYALYREGIRNCIIQDYDWKPVLADMFDEIQSNSLLTDRLTGSLEVNSGREMPTHRRIEAAAV